MNAVSPGILNSLLSRTLTLPGWESSLSDGLLCLIWAVGHLCSQIWSDLPSKDRSLRSIRHHLLLITDSLDVDSGHLGDFSCFETNRPPQCGHDNQKHHCRAKNRPYNNCDFVKLVPIFFKCVSSHCFCSYIGRELQMTIVSLVCMQGRTDCREVPTFSRDCPGVDKVSHVLKRSHASFQRAGPRKKSDDSARWENAPKSITVWTK